MTSIDTANETVENAILISFDSLRSDIIDQISPAKAPTFCRMRDGGAFFRNSIVQAPFTIPSHASMLSGLYPAKTGVRNMQHRVPSEVPTIFGILNQRGFHTIGSSPTPLLKPERAGFRGIDEHVPFRHRSIRESLAGLNGKRFFAFLHYWDTHTPYETLLPGFRPADLALNMLGWTRELERFRYLRRVAGFLWLSRITRIRAMLKEGNKGILPALMKGYELAVIRADRFLARILEIIEQTGLADKTLVVVTGDHGDSFNEHGEIDRAVGGRYEHGQFLYDNVLRVPLIFYCSGKSLSQKFDAQVQEIDITPTVLEALGVQYDGNIDGRPLWRESIVTKVAPAEALAFSEIVREDLNIEMRCVRSSSHKLIQDFKTNTFELYDIKSDREEKKNLYPGTERSETAALQDRLRAFTESACAKQASSTQAEREQVEALLRNLGYID